LDAKFAPHGFEMQTESRGNDNTSAINTAAECRFVESSASEAGIYPFRS
jgi:hypothetical protein